MGREAVCLVEMGLKRAESKVLLETTEIIIRGELRRKCQFSLMQNLEVTEDGLQFSFEGEPIILHIGPLAPKWLNAIQNPPSRVAKLGPKPGDEVYILGLTALEVAEELRNAGCSVYNGLPTQNASAVWIIASFESESDVNMIATIADHLHPHGAFWVIYPKGKRLISESKVMEAGKQIGLVDIKTLSFSSTHTGLKFVIPVANRKNQ